MPDAVRWARGHVLRGVLPLRRAALAPDALAGATLAALAVPEVLGYARIAGMPVVTGLYTMLLPVVVFAVLGSSRHLVVGADSATAAILAAGLGGLAVAGTTRYSQLAGTVAVVVAGLLVLARLIQLGFLANFLSRTVLVGFLTGVGLQVAAGQLGDMLGIDARDGSTVGTLGRIAGGLARVQLPDLLVAVAVIALVLGGRAVNKRIPTALLAIVAAIVVDAVVGLSRFGVAVLGPVPGGLPVLTLPGLTPSDVVAVLPAAAAMFVVILAQSAATSRAYAARFDETVDTDDDLVGLGGANLAAAVSGAFVVNGSPTKTQMVVGAGGRSQLAQLASVIVVLGVCVLATDALAHLPLAALGAVVFLIGVDLVDVAGLRRIFAVRRPEFWVAVLTAVAVVGLGVEQGIVLAVVASIIEHLRHSYAPHSAVLVKSTAGHWRSMPVTAGARTVDGLTVYRFGSGLYFANAARLVAEVGELARTGPRLRWFCLDAAAIGDIDYTAAAVLAGVLGKLRGAGIRVVAANVPPAVRAELDRYGITPDRYYDTSGEVLEHYQQETARG